MATGRPVVEGAPGIAGLQGEASSLISRVSSAVNRISMTGSVALIIVAGEWTGLARAALGAPVYAAALDIGLVLLFLAVMGRAVRAGTWRRGGVLAALVAVYFVVAAIEILNPNVPSLRAGLEGFRKTAFTAIAFAIVALSPMGDSGRFYRIVAVGSVPAFLMAVRQFFAPALLDLQILETSGISPITFHSAGLLRAFSPTAGPFHLGILAAAVLVISLVAARSGSRLWLVSATLAAVALGLTVTRANLVGAVVAVVLVSLLFPRPATRRMNLVQAVPVGAAAALAVLFAIGTISVSPGSPGSTPSEPGASSPPSSSPPTIGEVVEGLANPLTDRNLQFRFGYWAEYVQAVLERPLTGYGTSAAADGFDHFYEGTGKKNFEPHSLYFKAALEMGVGGLLLLSAILGYALARAAIKARSGEEAGVFAVGILAIFAVSGFSGPMLDAYPANILFWATCGWCIRQGQATPAAVLSRR